MMRSILEFMVLEDYQQYQIEPRKLNKLQLLKIVKIAKSNQNEIIHKLLLVSSFSFDVK